MKALTFFRSFGAAKVTSGLSSVGPPPIFRVTQALASLMMVGSPSLLAKIDETRSLPEISVEGGEVPGS